MEAASQTVLEAAAQTQAVVAGSVSTMQAAGEQTLRITDWMSGVHGWMSDFMTSLAATEKDLSQITHISREVNILALNARIEAARAGSAGAGFSVIAEAIGALARDTSSAAGGIATSLTRVRQEAEAFATGAIGVVDDAERILAGSKGVDQALADILRGMTALDGVANAIGSASHRVRDAVTAYAPDIQRLESAVRQRGSEIEGLSAMSMDLIDTSEQMVQQAIGLGGASSEQVFINRVQRDAAQLSRLLEAALDQGEISEAALFSSKGPTRPRC
jgi:methyl-accepting chemotaxis protein